eukprot:TRINITY_DN27594_c0_g1_i1.p1 TRINITY_DN27594_c0_g1~~TRINITY_DN27594_c0_g1_i1.p1  ORF type:complete len:434 (+),score=0.93 TRINITY_DN27594_c0_g1_i1:32-1333(+)
MVLQNAPRHAVTVRSSMRRMASTAASTLPPNVQAGNVFRDARGKTRVDLNPYMDLSTTDGAQAFRELLKFCSDAHTSVLNAWMAFAEKGLHGAERVPQYDKGPALIGPAAAGVWEASSDSPDPRKNGFPRCYKRPLLIGMKAALDQNRKRMVECLGADELQELRVSLGEVIVEHQMLLRLQNVNITYFTLAPARRFGTRYDTVIYTDCSSKGVGYIAQQARADHGVKTHITTDTHSNVTHRTPSNMRAMLLSRELLAIRESLRSHMDCLRSKGALYVNSQRVLIFSDNLLAVLLFREIKRTDRLNPLHNHASVHEELSRIRRYIKESKSLVQVDVMYLPSVIHPADECAHDTSLKTEVMPKLDLGVVQVDQHFLHVPLMTHFVTHDSQGSYTLISHENGRIRRWREATGREADDQEAVETETDPDLDLTAASV